MSNAILLKEYGVNLNTRSLADSIFSLKEEGSDFVVDFKDIETATPSFCHEMLVILKKKKTKFKLINVDENIKLQIRKAISSVRDIQ